MTLAAQSMQPRNLPDWLLSRGQNFVTTREISELLDVPQNEVPPITARWRSKHHAFSPTRGAYVLIPPEFRSWGAVPASYFIDAMMRYLDHDYYVAYLTAAEVFDSAHQRPQSFQVMSSGRLRDRSFGRVRLNFSYSKHLESRPVAEVNTPTGVMRVSTPEVTVLDLVASPHHGAGLSNVATVIGEFIKTNAIDVESLSRTAYQYPITVRQRVGWLLSFISEQLGQAIDLTLLLETVQGCESTVLSPSEAGSGLASNPWKVIVNTEVEPDI